MLKNILIFIPHFRPGYKAGGPIKSIDNLATYLSGKGVKVRIVCLNEDIDGEIYKDVVIGAFSYFRDNVEVLYVNRRNVTFSFIREFLVKDLYNYIYITGFFDSVFSIKVQLMSHLGAVDNQKLIFAPRGELYPGALAIKKVKKYIFLYLSKFLSSKLIFHATSEEEQDCINAVFPGADIRCAPNIPDLKENVDTKSSYNNNNISFIFLSRISEKKNLQLAIEMVLDANFGCSLDICGPIEDQGYFDRCMGQVVSHVNAHRILYKGNILPSKVNKTLRNYDFLLLPTFGENYGHVIAEALSASLPVIIGPATPWTKYIEKFHCGCILDLGDPGASKNVMQFIGNLDEGTVQIMRDNAYAAYMDSIKSNDYSLYFKKLFRRAYVQR